MSWDELGCGRTYTYEHDGMMERDKERVNDMSMCF